MDLRGTRPKTTYPYLVNTDKQYFYDGTGSVVTNVVQGVVSEIIPADINILYTAAVNQTITLPGAISSSHAAIAVNNKLYGGACSRWRYVFNDPDNDLTNFTTASFGAGSDAIADGCYSTEFTQSIFYISTTNVYKVDIGNFTSSSVVYSGNPIPLSDGVRLPTIKASGSYVFVGANTVPPYFLKIDINTGTLVQNQLWSDVRFGTNVNGCHASTLSEDLKWVYFGAPGGALVGDGIAKVSTSDITNYTSSGPIFKYFGGVSSSFGMSDDMVYLNGYVYAVSEAGLGGIAGYTLKINADTLITSSTNREDGIGNSFGIFTDGINIYKCINGEGMTVYINGDLNSPRRFAFDSGSTSISPNEMWITDGGRLIVTDWVGSGFPSPSSGIQWISLPTTKIGIGKPPGNTLDVAGNLNVTEGITSSYYTSTGPITTTGTTTAALFSLTNNTTWRVFNTGKTVSTSSITASAGFSDRKGFQSYTTPDTLTSSIALTATNTTNSFILSIFDNGNGTGTLTLVKAPQIK